MNFAACTHISFSFFLYVWWISINLKSSSMIETKSMQINFYLFILFQFFFTICVNMKWCSGDNNDFFFRFLLKLIFFMCFVVIFYTKITYKKKTLNASKQFIYHFSRLFNIFGKWVTHRLIEYVFINSFVDTVDCNMTQSNINPYILYDIILKGSVDIHVAHPISFLLQCIPFTSFLHLIHITHSYIHIICL